MFVDKKREIYLAVSLPAASVSLHVKKAPTSCGPTLCLKTFNYSSERLFSSHNFKKKKKNSSNWKQPPEPSLLIFHTKQSMKSLKKKKNNKKTVTIVIYNRHAVTTTNCTSLTICIYFQTNTTCVFFHVAY